MQTACFQRGSCNDSEEGDIVDDVRTFDVKVNGYEYQASYSAETVDNVFLPLLRRLKAVHDRLGRRTVVFLAAPPGAGKSTIATVLELLAKEELGREQEICASSIGAQCEGLAALLAELRGQEGPQAA